MVEGLKKHRTTSDLK